MASYGVVGEHARRTILVGIESRAFQKNPFVGLATFVTVAVEYARSS